MKRTFITAIEAKTGKVAILKDMKLDDISAKLADVGLLKVFIGYDPRAVMCEGAARYLQWYQGYHSG